MTIFHHRMTQHALIISVNRKINERVSKNRLSKFFGNCRINALDQGISIEYVLGIQYFGKVLVLSIEYIFGRCIGKSINTFKMEIQYPILLF